MLWTKLLLALLLPGATEAVGRSIAHAGKRHVDHASKRAKPPIAGIDHHHRIVEREEKAPRFLTEKTTSTHLFTMTSSSTC
jgi:carboxypeptidase D